MINMNSDPVEIYRGIVIFDDVIENPSEIIDMGKNENGWIEADVQDQDSSFTNPYHRNADKLILHPTVDYNPAWYFIAKALKGYGYRYSEMYKANFQSMEFPEMIFYPEGSGFFQSHVDSIPNVQRIFSSVLYLNDVEEGGETYFNDIDISIKPKAGRLAMFPANYMYRHEAKIPVVGEKFIIVTWYREDNG